MVVTPIKTVLLAYVLILHYKLKNVILELVCFWKYYQAQLLISLIINLILLLIINFILMLIRLFTHII